MIDESKLREVMAELLAKRNESMTYAKKYKDTMQDNDFYLHTGALAGYHNAYLMLEQLLTESNDTRTKD